MVDKLYHDKALFDIAQLHNRATEKQRGEQICVKKEKDTC